MVTALKQHVIVQAGGLIEVRSPDLRAGDEAEVIVLVARSEQPPSTAAPASPGKWRRHAGAIQSGDAHSSNNEKIDEDLGRAYGEANKPR